MSVVLDLLKSTPSTEIKFGFPLSTLMLSKLEQPAKSVLVNFVTHLGMVILFKSIQQKTAFEPKYVKLAGSLSSANLVHVENASSPIYDTLSGNIRRLIEELSQKALFSIVFTLFGKVTSSRLQQLSNELSTIISTPEGTEYMVFLAPAGYLISFDKSFVNRTFSTEVYVGLLSSTVISCILLQ